MEAGLHEVSDTVKMLNLVNKLQIIPCALRGDGRRQPLLHRGKRVIQRRMLTRLFGLREEFPFGQEAWGLIYNRCVSTKRG